MSGAYDGWLRFPHKSWRPVNGQRTYWECADCGTRRDDALTQQGPVYWDPASRRTLGIMGTPPSCTPNRRKP